VGQQKFLSAKAKHAILNSNGAIFVSAISAFEIGMKCNRGLLSLPMPVDVWMQQATQLHGISILPVDHQMAFGSTQLPNLHRDPADRIIIATAVVHQLAIVTPDQHIHSYPQVKAIW
jgi:PIN domain nuclease of toxin-antitoxin system